MSTMAASATELREELAGLIEETHVKLNTGLKVGDRFTLIMKLEDLEAKAEHDPVTKAMIRRRIESFPLPQGESKAKDAETTGKYYITAEKESVNIMRKAIVSEHLRNSGDLKKKLTISSELMALPLESSDAVLRQIDLYLLSGSASEKEMHNPFLLCSTSIRKMKESQRRETLWQGCAAVVTGIELGLKAEQRSKWRSATRQLKDMLATLTFMNVPAAGIARVLQKATLYYLDCLEKEDTLPHWTDVALKGPQGESWAKKIKRLSTSTFLRCPSAEDSNVKPIENWILHPGAAGPTTEAAAEEPPAAGAGVVGEHSE